MIGCHHEDFEKLYGRLSELDLDIRFPLADIGSFHWRRGEWNDGYYSYHYRRFTSHILSRLRLAEKQSILIVGCGFGFDEKNIRSLFEDVDLWSIDISAEMLRLALANRSPSRFALALAEKLPFPDQSFDRVLSREVIEHVISPRAMLKEIGRVLRPGGIAVVTTENEESLGPTHYYDHQVRKKLADLFRFPIPPPEYRNRAPSIEEMKEMTEEAGLHLGESFWDGALYKYLIEISPWVRRKMPRLAHFFSSLENHAGLARLFCDQVKHVLRKEGQGTPLDPPPAVHYACIHCKGQLQRKDGHYLCAGCGQGYAVNGGIPNFVPEQLPGPTEEALEGPMAIGSGDSALKIGGRLFPGVNRILRSLYCGSYLLLAFLATFFVKRNHRFPSGLLSQEDPYQRYLKIS